MKNRLTSTSSLLYSDQGLSVLSKTGNALTRFQRFARQIIFNKFKDLQHGSLTLFDQEGEHHFGQSSDDSDLSACIHIHNPCFYTDGLLGGSNAVAEGYVRGEWSCTNLTQVVRILARNLEQLEKLESGTASVAMWLYNLSHAFRKNTVKGSRKNISAHYDLSNEFFQLFLDSTMMYSSAVFETQETSLEEAATAKLKRICQKLDLNPTDHLLEIGTGWGGMAIYAAKHYGCRVTTTTISKEQYVLAIQKVRDEGLTDQVEVLLEDYRELKGTYDKLVSIEMIEAVGHQY